MALTVWLLWLLVGRSEAINSVIHHWRVSVTMIFGSLVGGGTSEGGGAVAFPVFTKVLMIPAGEARIFTYAIQSVGMIAASVTILYMRVPIERRFLALAAPAGIAGVIFSSTVIAPLLSLPLIRAYFTVMLTSLGIALLVQHARRVNGRNPQLLVYGTREKIIIVVTGLVGGIVSGMVGVGENIVAFIIIVMLFRISEKVATPTTVILMAVVSVAAFLSHIFLLHDFAAPVPGYWLAAVPIVVVGAPIGAMICSRLSRQVIRVILLILIAGDFISTLVIVPIAPLTYAIGGALLLLGTVGFYLMTKVRRYQPRSGLDSTAQWEAVRQETGLVRGW